MPQRYFEAAIKQINIKQKAKNNLMGIFKILDKMKATTKLNEIVLNVISRFLGDFPGSMIVKQLNGTNICCVLVPHRNEMNVSLPTNLNCFLIFPFFFFFLLFFYF